MYEDKAFKSLHACIVLCVNKRYVGWIIAISTMELGSIANKYYTIDANMNPSGYPINTK